MISKAPDISVIPLTADLCEYLMLSGAFLQTLEHRFQHHPFLPRVMQVWSLQPFACLPGIRPVQNILEKGLFQYLLIRWYHLPQSFAALFCFCPSLLFFFLKYNLMHGLSHLMQIHRLQQIIVHAKPQCFLGKLKIIVCAHNYNSRIGTEAAYLLRQVQPVHIRHFYISQKDICVYFHHCFQCLISVIHSRRDLYIQFRPGKRAAHSLELDLIIISYHDFVHIPLPLLSQSRL